MNRPNWRNRAHRWGILLAASALTALGTGLFSAGAQAVTLSPTTGSGSTYVGIAMRQWVAQGQSQGWKVTYSPVGSPTGLGMYGNNQVDFAGTEAEFKSIPNSTEPGRGYQYVPDVAGATAIMYNIDESSGKSVDYLHLDRATVARIFMGEITRWSDPAITRANKGIHFPDQPIRVVLRGNQSGTTALFYDFVANTLGSEFSTRFSHYGCGAPTIRPVLIQCSNGSLIANTVSFNDSDQIAQYIGKNPTSKWSIGFDEFGYAKVYGAHTAWIQNAAGKYVQPYAQNISAALESATLRSDLSQELSKVYSSTNPQAYPISAYSYMVTQCARTSARPTCAGPYANVGVSGTLSAWMRYIACDGQVTMAAQGYSPLPVNLSQEMENSVARLTGTSATKLTSSNCSNPRFKGSLGAGSTSPCDPFSCSPLARPSSGSHPTSTTPAARNSTGGTGSTGSTGTTGATGSGTAGGASTIGANGAPVVAIGGGDASNWRAASPTSFDAVIPDDPFGSLPAILVFAAATLPALIAMAARESRRRKVNEK